MAFYKTKVKLLIFISTFCISLLSAQDQEVVISIERLSDNVYMLIGQGGNIGIYIGQKNVIMIDDQFDRLSNKIKAAIESLTDKPITFLFNTHMHGDHTGGNASFNTDLTTLVAHNNVRKRVMAGQQKKLEDKKITKEYYDKMLPEVTFSEDITFYDQDETIMAFHVHNAHTDGDAIVYFVNNDVIHMGDTYFAGRYPYIDLNSGGSLQGYIDAHKKVLMIIGNETKIIPGHGRHSTKKELEIYVAMLEDIKTSILAAIEAGKSLEEIKSDTSISVAYDSTHGNGYIKPEVMRETFYKSLKSQ
ncbi:MBL fold metallo-hydrolase [uncultured Eudoraea sp.]|uniref:MBL fold metallo-hydrolase n=1 Tax=uncultured Eudoraea sp. TaxID=1035614 RepID=UPI00262422DF|nr:MBL fold metallo-hydrolase [uncultured Eudoraea sp.]